MSQARLYRAALVISDTHIGLPEKQVFQEDFEDFVDYLASNQILNVKSEEGDFQIEVPKAIVLLGDFFDLWDGRYGKLPPFISNYARVFTEIADVFYLRGNHDYIIPNIEPRSMPNLKRFQILEYLVLELGGRACFFIHGHQFMSAFGSTSLRIESYVNPFYSILESFLSRFSFGHGREILLALTGVSFFSGPS